MSPILIKELPHARKEFAGMTFQIKIHGNIDLFVNPDGTLGVYFDARQERGVKAFLLALNGKRAPITDIECESGDNWRIFYQPSRLLKPKLITQNERAVHIHRSLPWEIHVGRTPFLKRRYCSRGADSRPDLPKYTIR